MEVFAYLWEKGGQSLSEHVIYLTEDQFHIICDAIKHGRELSEISVRGSSERLEEIYGIYYSKSSLFEMENGYRKNLYLDIIAALVHMYRVDPRHLERMLVKDYIISQNNLS